MPNAIEIYHPADVPMCRALGKFTLILTALAVRSEAYTLIWIPKPVRPDFQVFVQDRGRLVEGMPVEITGKGHRIETNTDKNGLASFATSRPKAITEACITISEIFSGRQSK